MQVRVLGVLEDGVQDEGSSRASSIGSKNKRATRGLLLRSTSTATVRKRNESDDDFLARATHLRLQNKGISSLGAGNVFDACVSLKVLYLYDNCLESLDGLQGLHNLEQLYVDNNILWSVSGTLPCRRLVKLHLSGNSISTLCGLEEANCLEELHVARQRVQLEEKRFSIDQASIDAIKDSLLVLDASGNGMRDDALENLVDLYLVERLILADNDIHELSTVVDFMTSMEELRECDLRGNPVSRTPKYFERAVTRCGERLETLDGKPVYPQHRSMLQRLDRYKRGEARKLASKGNPSTTSPAPIAELGASTTPPGREMEQDGSMAKLTATKNTTQASARAEVSVHVLTLPKP